MPKVIPKKMLQGLDSQSTARKSNGHFHPEVRFAYPRNLFGSREMTFFSIFSPRGVRFDSITAAEEEIMAGFQQSIMDQVNVGRAEVQKSVDGVGDVNGGQVPLPLDLQVDNDQDLLPLQIEEDDNEVLLHLEVQEEGDQVPLLLEVHEEGDQGLLPLEVQEGGEDDDWVPIELKQLMENDPELEVQDGNIQSDIVQDGKMQNLQGFVAQNDETGASNYQDGKMQNLQSFEVQHDNTGGDDQGKKLFEIEPANDERRAAERGKEKQNIVINLDHTAVVARVKVLRNPHKYLYKKILKRNHKLKLRALRELRRKTGKSQDKGRKSA